MDNVFLSTSSSPRSRIRGCVIGLVAAAAFASVLQAGQRPANAPPLVPVRLDANGNFRIAPPYAADPAFTEKAGVPKGRVIRFTMNSADSRIFPTGPVGRGGGGRGAQAGPAPEPPQHQTFDRQVAVYVPAGYVANTAAPFIVVQDERWFIPEDAPAAQDGNVALQRNATAPNGAWDYHRTLIPGSERKPLRIWLHVSENDIGADAPVEQMRNWVAANNRMAGALKAKGYPYQFVFSEASGHVDRRVELQTMPEAFEWVWKGYTKR